MVGPAQVVTPEPELQHIHPVTLPPHVKIEDREQQQGVRANAPCVVVPPPWRLKGDVYLFSFWTSSARARNLPNHTYSPLEASSDYARPGSASGGKPVGGLGMVQVIRYHDSPVGPYDEMLFVPGKFEWDRSGTTGGHRDRDTEGVPRRNKGSNPKISRIYVSQKESCYNGRINWNVPKHLARFDWSTDAAGATVVKIYPYDTNHATAAASASSSPGPGLLSSGEPKEAAPSTLPFFQATFTPVPYVPNFPFSTSWVNSLGFDTDLILPPLPDGQAAATWQELPGSTLWCRVRPVQWTRRAALGWFDVRQADAVEAWSQHSAASGSKTKLGGERSIPDQNEDLGVGHHYENFWPGWSRWQLGMKMEDAELILQPPSEAWQRSQPRTSRL